MRNLFIIFPVIVVCSTSIAYANCSYYGRAYPPGARVGPSTCMPNGTWQPPIQPPQRPPGQPPQGQPPQRPPSQPPQVQQLPSQPPQPQGQLPQRPPSQPPQVQQLPSQPPQPQGQPPQRPPSQPPQPQGQPSQRPPSQPPQVQGQPPQQKTLTPIEARQRIQDLNQNRTAMQGINRRPRVIQFSKAIPIRCKASCG